LGSQAFDQIVDDIDERDFEEGNVSKNVSYKVANNNN
jgi:hypothetical protein